MPGSHGTRGERRAVRRQLVEAGLLPPDASLPADKQRIGLALDVLRHSIPSSAPRNEEDRVALKMEQLKSRLIAMKGQLAEESQRSRVAEQALREALSNA